MSDEKKKTKTEGEEQEPKLSDEQLENAAGSGSSGGNDSLWLDLGYPVRTSTTQQKEGQRDNDRG